MTPSASIRDLVVRVMPSILSGRKDGLTRIDEFEARHVEETGTKLLQRSQVVAGDGDPSRRQQPDAAYPSNRRNGRISTPTRRR
ncbi:hypothetical protein [Mycobacterium sp. D16Q16]|uniref:hypothetical protein n=1 Tax=Mycobacterium sp. D16Q16 TaxID=1855659 RepID=UPI002570F016|nr:hypothetical protein [Mycobacterium sp. D16Q16]